MTQKNYYDILGIQLTANQDEVKQAFRKLSVKFHPDKNDGDAFLMEMFKSINEANEILSNPEKRKAYDQKLIEVVAGDSNSDYITTTSNGANPSHPSAEEQEQVYTLWNQYLEKKKKTDEAYGYLVKANNLDEPRFVTTKKVLGSLLVMLLVWLFLKPATSSTATNNGSGAFEWTTNETAQVYKKPNVKSDILTELPVGIPLHAIDETNYFIKVEYNNGRGKVYLGFIRKSALKKNSY